MNAKTPEKRELKGYKILPSRYTKAMRRAKREKVFLANLIEIWVDAYADGRIFQFVDEVRKPSDQQLGA